MGGEGRGIVGGGRDLGLQGRAQGSMPFSCRAPRAHAGSASRAPDGGPLTGSCCPQAKRGRS